MDSHYPFSEWRLLNTGAQDGASNMALDEAILEAVMAGETPPTLRFYAWQPACLSLGYGQTSEEIDRNRCSQQGWNIVRRPTGGQAILHTDELTYSVCAPLDEPRVAGGVVESYRRLAAGLLAGLRELGLEPAEAKPDYPESQLQHGPICFEGPARYEITVRLRKLIGSAQSRRMGCLLQHGTLPLKGDITRIVQALAFDSPAERSAAAQRLLGRALTLESALGRTVSFDEAVQAMTTGFAQSLNLILVPGTPSAKEMGNAQRIRKDKYLTDEWTFRK